MRRALAALTVIGALHAVYWLGPPWVRSALNAVMLWSSWLLVLCFLPKAEKR